MFYYFSYKYWVVCDFVSSALYGKKNWLKGNKKIRRYACLFEVACFKNFDYKRDCNGLGPNKKRNHMSITQNMMKKADLFMKFRKVVKLCHLNELKFCVVFLCLCEWAFWVVKINFNILRDFGKEQFVS